MPGASAQPAWLWLSLHVRTRLHIHRVEPLAKPNEHRLRNLRSTESAAVCSCELARGRLVQDQPVQTQLTHSPDKLIEVHRFLHIGICTQAVAVEPVLFLFRGCQ